MQGVENAGSRRETADFPTFMLDAALEMQYACRAVVRCSRGIFCRSGVSLLQGASPFAPTFVWGGVNRAGDLALPHTPPFVPVVSHGAFRSGCGGLNTMGTAFPV